jgi:hypothetical protein
MLAAAALVAPTSAHAGATLVLPDGTPAAEEQAWLEASAAVSPPTVVTVHRQRCPGTDGRACALLESPDIYVAGDDWPWDELNTRRDALLHEVGHMLDRPWTGFSDAGRDAFRALIGDERPWRTEPDSPHEQFAEAWRLCALRAGEPGGPPVSGGYRYAPAPAVHARVCELIASEGAALGWTAGSAPAGAGPGRPPGPGGVDAFGVAPAGGGLAPPMPAAQAGALGAAAASRLSAQSARRTVATALRRRLPRVARVRVTCRRLTAQRLRCRFTARHGARSLAGQGTVARASRGRVGYRLAVIVGGSRRTTWTG